MLHRADVSDRALGLLMDRCRVTFANPEADGVFTLYTYPDRNQVKYRVTARMHQAAEKYIKSGAQRLCGEINPIRHPIRLGHKSTSLVSRGHGAALASKQ